MNKYIKFFICILIPFLAAAVWWFFTKKSVSTRYVWLQKPELTPPSWVFWPAWTVLYLLMGISLFMIVKNWLKWKIKAFIVFALQIILNVLWSYMFFFKQDIKIALIVIILLWISILVNIIMFYRLNKTAWILLLPYILWVSFAWYLNYQIYILNTF